MAERAVLVGLPGAWAALGEHRDDQYTTKVGGTPVSPLSGLGAPDPRTRVVGFRALELLLPATFGWQKDHKRHKSTGLPYYSTD